MHQFHHLFFFFFSSRRRHTRCLSDWSSDVCSSDLGDEHEAARRALRHPRRRPRPPVSSSRERNRPVRGRDRKSTRLNSSHLGISYAVFCLKKKKKKITTDKYQMRPIDRSDIVDEQS